MTDSGQGGETGIIQRFFAPLAEGVPGAYGLLDDAGCIEVPGDHETVLTTDMVVAGVHVPGTAAPRDMGYKALAVNVSDLCAKGAEPSVYLLSLAVSGTRDEPWLEGLGEGLASAQADFGCRLLGGDTVRTPGPDAISITAAGFVPKGGMIRRSGAKDGDEVYVTGTIGDAALGLALLKDSGANDLPPQQAEFLRARYWRPQPRLEAIPVLRAYASAAMDISDGLAGDFAKLCAASGLGGRIEAADVPLSAAAAAWLGRAPERLEAVLTGGDDYEVLMTVPREKTTSFEGACAAAGLQITCIGRMSPEGEGVRVLAESGRELNFERTAYDHF